VVGAAVAAAGLAVVLVARVGDRAARTQPGADAP
jgi:hypothetical protein